MENGRALVLVLIVVVAVTVAITVHSTNPGPPAETGVPTLPTGTLPLRGVKEATGPGASAEQHGYPRVVFIGDTRTGHGEHRRIVDMMRAQRPDVVLHSGDLVNDGNEMDDWERFFEIEGGLINSTVYLPAPGNHEREARTFYMAFDYPLPARWRSVDIGNLHIILLDSLVDIGNGSLQYKWLEDDLQSVDARESIVIAVFHHPPYSTGPHEEDEMGLRTTIVPLFEMHHVELVVSGHDHHYERAEVNDVVYIVTGGGGAPLHDPVRTADWSRKEVKAHHFCLAEGREDGLEVEVIDIDGNEIDRFVVGNRS